MSKPFSIWVISPGLTGTENQCLGVAEALARCLNCHPGEGGDPIDIITKRLNLRAPYRWWSPFLSWGEGPGMLAPTSDPVAPPWPDVVIAAGRTAIGMARYIKRASQGHTFVCILQNPKISPHYFDLVAMPVHDHNKALGLDPRPPESMRPPGGARGSNLILTNGAPNRITADSLAAAREHWQDTLVPLPAPRTAVLIGGNSRTHRLGATTMDRLIAHLKDHHATQGGSLMITVSRRTPQDLRGKLTAAFDLPLKGEREHTVPPSVMLYTGDGPNPYAGFLAFADHIICTTDSTSMISDAATTGKPISFFPLPGGSPRHDRFMAHCRDVGVGVQGATYTPWHDADRVAEVTLKMIKERVIVVPAKAGTSK